MGSGVKVGVGNGVLVGSGVTVSVGSEVTVGLGKGVALEAMVGAGVVTGAAQAEIRMNKSETSEMNLCMWFNPTEWFFSSKLCLKTLIEKAAADTAL